MALPGILDQILRQKRVELAAAQQAIGLPRVKEAALTQPPARPFAAALRPAGSGDPPRLIAEIKKVSPARGALAPHLDVRAMARLYGLAGAAAMSVLTDERFFSGSLDDLVAARAEVAIPVLRKDFVIGAYQLFEARVAGADAALLIVAALASPLADTAELDRVHSEKCSVQSEDAGGLHLGVGVARDAPEGEPDLRAARRRLRDLLAAARTAGVECLVEVHDEAELEVAIDVGAGVIGINNRNLRTFETRLEVTERLAPRVPRDVVLVSESGINTADDVRRVRRAGASAILVGSAIVSAPDPAAKIQELIG